MLDALKLESRDVPEQLLGGYRVRRELPELTRQLGILLRAGERLDRALATLSEFARTQSLKTAILSVRDDVRAGDLLSTALRRHPALFSDFYVNVVALGESGGNLAGAVRRVADHLLRQQRFSRALTTAVSYPLLLLGITGLSLVVLLVYVLPQFRELFEDTGVDLPWMTAVLLGFSEFLRQYGWVAAGITAVLIAAAWGNLRQPESRFHWHRLLLRLPLVGALVRRIDVSRFAGSLADALEGGVPLLDSLRLARSSVANLYLRHRLDGIVNIVREGGGLAEGLHGSAVFPVLAVRMIHVGEESGRLVESLRNVAEVYSDEFDAAAKRLLNVLEPLLILIIGSGVAVVILAMISAIQRLNTFSI